MHSQLVSYINQYWGKAWALQLLHDYYPELRKHLAPARIIPHGSEVSPQIYKALTNSRKSFGSPDILARASHPKDWFGLVDFLPTVRVPDPERERRSSFMNNNREEFQDILNYRIENSFSKHNEKYAKELHYLLTPYIKHTLYTVTEHPNEENHLFVDTGRMGSIAGREIVQIINDRVHGQKVQGLHKHIAMFIKKIRDTGALEISDVMQYEVWITPQQQTYLFQTRKFSNRFPSIFKTLSGRKRATRWSNTRIMGKLPSAQETFYHIHDQHLDAINTVGNVNHPSVIFSSLLASPWATIEISPPNLRGFVSEIQSALFHNLTAPAQAVLQNNGFVLLDYAPPRYDNQLVTTHFDERGIYREKATPKKQKH